MAFSSGAPTVAAPVLVAFVGPAPQRRLTVFFRIILIIPVAIVSIFIYIAAFVITVISWFAALFIGRLPRFAAEFLPGFVRWVTRVTSYFYLMTDKYPPFTLEDDATYPVRVSLQPGPLNRWAVLFRIILIIPASIVSGVVQNGTSSLVAFVTWVIVLVNGSMPPALFQALSAAIRYQTRVTGYFVMATSEYPWGLFGDVDTTVFGASAAYGAYGVPGAYGAPPPAPGTSGAPPAPTPGTYGAPPAPTPGTYGAPPTVGSYSPPPPPDPAAGFLSAPQSAAAPVPPTLPGVAFTFGGPGYLWGYTDDRSHCGIWSATDLTAPPQMWPIGDQGEGWARFRDLEPNAVALADPTPPPAANAWEPAATSYGAPPPPTFAAAPSPTSASPADDPYWRIVLSSGARQLMVVFLVLGVIFSFTNRGVFFRRTTPNTAVASIRAPGVVRSLPSSVTIHPTSGPFVRTTSSIALPARASATPVWSVPSSRPAR